MSADKRNFTEFHKFPGGISTNGEDKHRYVFPPVYSKDSLNRSRVWRIVIRLIKANGNKPPARRKTNWEPASTDTIVPIAKKYLDNEVATFPKNTIAQVWTEQGIYASGDDADDRAPLLKNITWTRTIAIPTYVTTGKNIGKKNETTIFTQALIAARSKYLKKVQESGGNDSKRFFPFAVHKYEDKPRDERKHVRWPAAVQRKLDGGRAVAYDAATPTSAKSKAVMYTRKLKDLEGNTDIINALDTLFPLIKEKYPGAYLDGELYKHGLSLQQISGIMRRPVDSATTRREEKDGEARPKLEFHIFDVFFPLDKQRQKLPYAERKKILDDIAGIAATAGAALLVNVETFVAKHEKEATALHDGFLKEGYEGSIIRNLDAPYDFGTTREKRTYQARKRKPRYSAEYEVIGFGEGVKGKDKGAIIWELKTKKGVRFTSTPVGMDYEERYRVFREMTPQKFAEYKGKMMTVEYDDISDDGVPLRAKAKGIRILD
jgi:ATP-dependent DNA ligase